MRGLRVVIEGKFADHPSAADVVLQDARNRVKSGLAHISAAAVYPLELRSAPTAKMLGVLKKSNLKYRIVSETHESDSWFEGTPADLILEPAPATALEVGGTVGVAESRVEKRLRLGRLSPVILDAYRKGDLTIR